MIRNFLAFIGLVSLILVAVLGYKSSQVLTGFDPQAKQVYTTLITDLLTTKSVTDATVWKTKVAEDVSAEDVEDAIKAVANELNISNVGELPLSADVEAKTGKPYRFVKIFMFCNSITAAKMMDYRDSFSAYLPCRMSLIEDKTGQLWIYALNMDLMIYGGSPLPADLKKEAIHVKDIMLEIIQRGAEGDF